MNLKIFLIKLKWIFIWILEHGQCLYSNILLCKYEKSDMAFENIIEILFLFQIVNFLVRDVSLQMVFYWIWDYIHISIICS